MWATLVAGSPAAHADPAGDPAADPTVEFAGDGRVATATRAAGGVAIDGVMDEAPWSAAPASGGFWQRSPDAGARPQFETEFRVLYDDDAVYVGVVARDEAPDQIQRFLTRRDESSQSDWIQVSIDPYRDRRSAYVFAINPLGVQRDFLVYDNINTDAGWDGVWEGAAQIGADGWTAELRIPLEQLRYAPAPEQEWGLQVTRIVGRTQEESVWASTPPSTQRAVGLYGVLRGLRSLAPVRRIELLPYALGGVQVGQDGGAGDVDAALLGAIGLDLEYRLGASTTLSATLNPDFGQVEADPSDVNLTDVETFFSERRPFFVEGSDAFRFGLATGDSNKEQLFYSRRIGAPPHVAPPDADLSGRTTTIYGAAKFVSKTAGGWSFGALDAVTAEERAVAPTGGSVAIEPLTHYAVVQVQRESNRGRTRVGGALTSVSRRLDGAGIQLLHDNAVTGGIQLGHRFWRDAWLLSARLVGSHVRGNPVAIDRTQRASQRYYQRPDAPHLDYDPSRTQLSGAGLLWSVGKDDGGHLRYGLLGDLRSPGLELNDLGFQLLADRVSHWGWVRWLDERPGPRVFRYMVEAQQWLHADWEPRVREYGARLNGEVKFASYWRAFGGFGLSRHVWDTKRLRGGPAIRRDAEPWAFYGATTDERRAVRVSVEGDASAVPRAGSWWLRVHPELHARPRSNLELAIGFEYIGNVTDDQYVQAALAVDDPGDPGDPDASAQHVLAHLDQTTLSLTVRASYTLSPTVSFQLYAQPFVSAGRFDAYKVVVDPGAADYGDRLHTFAADEIAEMDGALAVDLDRDGAVDYAIGRPDFNVRELRANAVLRWEYRPGSTAFLVWRRDAASFGDAGRFALGDELSALAGARAEDAVLVKVSYRWTP